MNIPPFTSSTCPVIYPAPSDARNPTDCAISASVPARPSGIVAIIAARCFSSSTAVMAVSMYPGATAFTVIPREATSRASERVSPISPAFYTA